MEEAGRAGRTVLFVSHNLPTVLRLCSRSLLLDAGRLVANGRSSEVIQTYLQTKALGTDARDGLRDVPRVGGMGEKIRFTGCSIINSHGQPTRRLLFGEPVTVRLDARASVAVDHISLSVGFDTDTEVRAATAMSEESDTFFDYRAGQQRTVFATAQHFVLNPGKYFITLAATRDREALDRLGQALSFEVDSVPWEGTPPWTGEWGVLRVQADWSSCGGER
jgi:hypothetical protein